MNLELSSASTIQKHVQSHLVYLDSLVPIKMCLVCEKCGLLNHFLLANQIHFIAKDDISISDSLYPFCLN